MCIRDRVVVGGVGISGNMNVGQYNTSLHNIRGNLLLGLGNVIASADSILTINQNSATPISAPNNVIHMSAVDGRSAQYGADSFGTSATSGAYFRRARGTSASPSAVQANDALGTIIARGYGTTGFNPASGSASAVSIVAAENYSDTNQGTYVLVRTIPTGSNIAVTAATISNITTQFYSNLVVTGNLAVVGNVGYTMGNYQNWTQGNVYTISSALDQLAARLKAAGF